MANQQSAGYADKLKSQRPWSNFSNVRRWVCVGQNKEPKNTVGINISTTKSDQWLTLSEALRSVSEPWSKGVVGFVLTDLPSDELSAIDLDDVLDAEGEGLSLTIKALIADAVEAGCYIERTPSGEGLRVIGKLSGHLGEKWGTVPVDLPGQFGSFELYACPNARYITVTGETIHAPETCGFLDPIFDQLAPFTNGPSGAVSSKPEAALSGEALAVAQSMATDADRALGASVLATALTRIKSAVPGTRNHTLNNQAFEVAKHIKTGMIDVNEAVAELTAAALECGLSESEIAATLNSAFHGAVKSGETPLLASQAAELLSGVTIPQEPERPIHRATPFDWAAVSTVKPRSWLYGQHMIRKFVSCTISPGGVGKSSLLLVEAMAIATGRPILGIEPNERARVYYWNDEDPQDEIQRRMLSLIRHHNIDHDELNGWLFYDSGRHHRIIVANTDRNGSMIAEPVIEDLKATLRADKIDVLIVDPFKSVHRVSENDSTAIDAVATAFAEIADECNCSIELIHHSRKLNGHEGTVDDARGARALIDKARSARILNPMTAADAQKYGIDEPWRLFRVDNGKANMAPRAANTQWYRSASVDLQNAQFGEKPLADNVGAIEVWQPPVMSVLSDDQLAAVKRELTGSASGEMTLWRKDIQAGAWIGRGVAAALSLDTAIPSDRDYIKSLIARWIKAGWLRTYTLSDENRKPKEFLEITPEWPTAPTNPADLF